MFLSTVSVSERVTRTALEKVQDEGTLEEELRGGRKTDYKDAVARAKMREHITKFTRIESHYCRVSTSYQCLSPELNIARMHQMHSQEYTDYPGSVALYRSVFKSMKLKFHSPKKGLCGICDSFLKGTAATKDRLQNEYHAHIRKKQK